MSRTAAVAALVAAATAAATATATAAAATGMGTGAVGSATSAAPPSTRAGWARRARGVTPGGRQPLLRLASGESSTWLLAGQRSPRTPQVVGAPWLTRWRPWGSEPRAAPSRRAVFAHRRVRTRDQRGRDDR